MKILNSRHIIDAIIFNLKRLTPIYVISRQVDVSIAFAQT